jgi:peptidoglycan lytic transglycosylase G
MLTGLSRKRIVLFAIGMCFLAGMSLAVGFGFYLMNPAKEGGTDQVFFVREGSNLKKVADQLHSRKIITGKGLFLLWARVMGYSRNIKAGEYRLNAGMTPLKILSILERGVIITHPVTIPEGFTIKQIGDLLGEKGLVHKDEFLALAGDPNIARGYGISGPGLEGYLYPDTYHFGRGLSSMSVIDVMVRRFKEVYAPFREIAERSGMTMEKAVTLASIVEKETGLGKERPLIASVFLNRLNKRMRLESDPTVIYGLKDFNGNLKRKHLTEHTPYNTYLIHGLPPGPIANPGQEAIKAVLFPAKSNYLYFVSKNDGSHYFSKTLSEHNRAVVIYQKKRRKRPGKTS